MATLAPAYPAVFPIPVDLFVSKKHSGLTRGELVFVDSSGTIVFKVVNPSKASKKATRQKVLLDASGNALVTIRRSNSGSWQGFKGSGDGEKEEMIFRVQKTLKKLRRTELEMFLTRIDSSESSSDFKVKGSPFQRSCSIYRGDSIVAQTSLMYKLHQILLGRRRFRVTIFPGPVDTVLFVSLVVIFLD